MSSGLQLQGLVLDGGPATPREATYPGGTVVAVIGPSGGERSRLLLTVAGLARPSAGEVLLDGAPITPAAVGVVDEDHTLVDGLTPTENITARVMARRDLADDDRDAITALLSSLGLPESSWHNLVEQLSGGQQQRVAVARALADSPDLLCLDDPASELDAASAALVWSAIEQAAARGAVVLLGLPDAEEAGHADLVIEVGV